MICPILRQFLPYPQHLHALIGQHFFRPEYGGHIIFLTIDEATLWKIGQEFGAPLHFAAPEMAVRHLVESVRREISQRGGWTVGHIGLAQYPSFLGLLAIQVLAAFRMHEGGKWTEKAYWGRLRELLKEPDRRPLPLGLTYNAHQDLWTGLQEWANMRQQERWGTVCFPSRAPARRRRDHVGLPKSQALLNLADLTRLPEFFHRAGFRPREEHLDFETVRAQVETYRDDPTVFGPHARRVLGDDRCAPACQQIREYLKQWDGRCEGRTPASRASLWLQLLPYDPPELQGGLTVGNVALQEVLGREVYKAQHSVFRPFHKDYVLTVRSSRGVWEEKRKAKPGDDVLVLVRAVDVVAWLSPMNEVAEAGVKGYQSEKAPALPHYKALRGLPVGWRAFHFQICAELPVRVPEWVAYEPIEFVGGLRIERDCWLAGAGPAVLVHATNIATLWIDGQEYTVVNQHIPPAQAPCLDESGTHRIRLPETFDVQTIEVRDGEIASDISGQGGWIQQDHAWPSLTWLSVGPAQPAEANGLTIRGPVVLGGLTRSHGSRTSVHRQWLESVMRLRGYRWIPGQQASSLDETPEQRLLYQLAMAGTRRTRF